MAISEEKKMTDVSIGTGGFFLGVIGALIVINKYLKSNFVSQDTHKEYKESLTGQLIEIKQDIRALTDKQGEVYSILGELKGKVEILIEKD